MLFETLCRIMSPASIASPPSLIAGMFGPSPIEIPRSISFTSHVSSHHPRLTHRWQPESQHGQPPFQKGRRMPARFNHSATEGSACITPSVPGVSDEPTSLVPSCDFAALMSEPRYLANPDISPTRPPKVRYLAKLHAWSPFQCHHFVQVHSLYRVVYPLLTSMAPLQQTCVKSLIGWSFFLTIVFTGAPHTAVATAIGIV